MIQFLGNWNVSLLMSLFNESIEKCKILTIYCPSNWTRDKMVWTMDPRGNFSCKSVEPSGP